MKFRSLLAAAGLVLAVACQDKPVDPTPAPSENLPINFTASLYQFTKATDSAFENGDEIGVNIFNPECYLYNAKYTYNNGTLTAAVANEWYEDTELEAVITAVYPYSETTEVYVENQSFLVNADQSAKTGYTMSDLMFAVTKSKPTAEAVTLPFKHALSKIIVTVDNQLGEEIEQLWFTDVKGEVSYVTSAPQETLTATGSTGTIKAYKSGDNTWQLIVAPQTASPKLALTTSSGKQFTFVLAEEVAFASGKVSTATVTVSTESIYTSFTPEITDWVADNELNFSQDDVEVELPEGQPVVETKCRLTARVNKAITWYDKYIYSWNADGEFSGEWPGTKMSWDKEDGDYYVYYYEFPGTLDGTVINYVINNGSEQTCDLEVTLNGADTVVTIEEADKK